MCTRGVTRSLAEALSEHLYAVNVDRRGRGDSDDRGGAPPFDPAREVEDVAAVIAAVGGHAAVYGHSSGAAVALRAAAADIGITRVVLHDAPYNLPGGEERGQQWHADLHAMLTEGRAGDALAAFLTKVGMPAPVVEASRSAPHWPAMEAVSSTLAYDSAAMGDRYGGLLPVELLARLEVPALVVVGGADHGFMIQVAQRIVEGLQDGLLEHLVGAGHDVAADLVAPRILPFLLA